MKIAFICDSHIPDDNSSPQHAFFLRCVKALHEDNLDAVISVGDITSYGETNVFDSYLEELKDFEHHFVLGNSDVRNEETVDYFKRISSGFELKIGARCVIGINTCFGIIEDDDIKKIKNMNDGDILILHHGPHRLSENSRAALMEIAEVKSLVIIHGHSHSHFDYTIGKSRVIGLRALDPDKSIGNYPCITYFDITDDIIDYSERIFDVSKNVIRAIGDNFGISCVDNHRDVLYALENNVKRIELRCNGADWEPDYELLPLIEKWRKKTNGYLSVHMPNLFWKDGGIAAEDKWYNAVQYAKDVRADSLTIHPPRVKKCVLLNDEAIWNKYLELYVYAVKSMSDDVKIGIENLHMHRGELDDENRAFGYTPEEVSLWITAVNVQMGKTERVGHVLDVGHARNNGSVAQRFPVGRWYTIMGKKAVAYHIHQVVPTENGLKNHCAIEDWFGPMISYVSYFYAWDKEILNHAPIFLEVRGCENYQKSIDAFRKLLDLNK